MRFFSHLAEIEARKFLSKGLNQNNLGKVILAIHMCSFGLLFLKHPSI